MANLSTKVVTGKVRLSYVSVFNKKSTVEGGVEKYSTSIIIPKSDTVTISKIRAAIEAAYKEGEGKLRGNSKTVPPLSSIRTPLRDSTTDKPNDEAYKDSYFLNASSMTTVGIVDKNLNPIMDENEIYSGVYARVSINFFTYNKDGISKGIACGLNNIMKLEDGERLGGKSDPAKDFATDESDDFLE